MNYSRPIHDYVLTPHACQQMANRHIPLELVREVLTAPQQRIVIRPGRIVLQSRCEVREPRKVYLLRVIVDVDRRPAEIVTAYVTSRITKYWESQV